MLTIVTATYNRAHTLPNLYKSILKNKKFDKDITWLIIDDGSVDNTKELVNKWIKEKQIKINYFYQKNSGKMAAINNYIAKVDTELCTEVDSDDYLTDNAVKIILENYTEKIKNSNAYGMLFRRFFIGKDKQTHLPKEEKEIKIFDLYNKKGFAFDSVIVFKSNIRKKYKYKLENNEKFITEARMYNELDLNYDGVFLIDNVVVNCEYLEDGYSKNINKLFINNPYGYFEYHKECFYQDFKGISFKKRLYFIKHYIMFGCLTKKSKIYVVKNCKGTINKILTLLLVIPGYIKTKHRFNKK